MLSNMHWEHIEVMGGGSVYPVKTGRHTLGFAFFYRVNGEKAPRKVVTGCSNEELREKAVKFLDKIEKECVEAEMATKGISVETSEPRALTFEDVSNEWFLNVYTQKRIRREISYSSFESRKYSLQAINDVIGDKMIGDIDDDVARELIRRCSVKKSGQFYSVSHVDKLQQAFRMVMAYGVEKGYCTYVPKKVKLNSNLTEVDKDDRFLDEEELNVIFDIVNKNRRYNTIVHLLLATGLRQEEAFALNVADFRPKKNGLVEIIINKTVVETEEHIYRIVYETKTSSSKRKVYVPNEVYQMVMDYYNYVIDNETEFQTYLRSLYDYEGYIFLNKDMKPINKRTFERNFKNFLERNGKDKIDFNVTLHMLRHSYVSLLGEDMSLENIAMLIGDSYKTTHEMYQSITNKTKHKASKNASKYFNMFSRNRL